MTAPDTLQRDLAELRPKRGRPPTIHAVLFVVVHFVLGHHLPAQPSWRYLLLAGWLVVVGGSLMVRLLLWERQMRRELHAVQDAARREREEFLQQIREAQLAAVDPVQEAGAGSRTAWPN